MASKVLALLSLATLSVYVNSSVIDDAKLELNELKAIVQGAIFSALDEIDYSNGNVENYRDEGINAAFLSISEEYQTLIDELNTLKSLANFTGTDIGPCLEFQEPILIKLNQTTAEALIDCVVDVNNDLKQIETDSKYKVDTLINEVGVYEFQVDRCGNSIICVEPILTQIQLAMVSLPLKVRVEVVKIGELFDNLKDSFKECTDTGIGHVAALGNDLIEAITYCIDYQLPNIKQLNL